MGQHQSVIDTSGERLPHRYYFTPDKKTIMERKKKGDKIVGTLEEVIFLPSSAESDTDSTENEDLDSSDSQKKQQIVPEVCSPPPPPKTPEPPKLVIHSIRDQHRRRALLELSPLKDADDDDFVPQKRVRITPKKKSTTIPESLPETESMPPTQPMTTSTPSAETAIQRPEATQEIPTNSSLFNVVPQQLPQQQPITQLAASSQNYSQSYIESEEVRRPSFGQHPQPVPPIAHFATSSGYSQDFSPMIAPVDISRNTQLQPSFEEMPPPVPPRTTSIMQSTSERGTFPSKVHMPAMPLIQPPMDPMMQMQMMQHYMQYMYMMYQQHQQMMANGPPPMQAQMHTGETFGCAEQPMPM